MVLANVVEATLCHIHQNEEAFRLLYDVVSDGPLIEWLTSRVKPPGTWDGKTESIGENPTAYIIGQESTNYVRISIISVEVFLKQWSLLSCLLSYTSQNFMLLR